MSYKTKLIRYIFDGECSDIKSKIVALTASKEYLADLSKKIPSNYYAIYDRLGLIPENNNRYNQFIEILEKKFNLNTNILEVGGGNLPRIAERIANIQLNTQNGKITVIDPMLSTKKTNYNNLTLCKDNFTLETDIKQFDLIISLFPCEATETLIYKALTENKNLLFRMCDCIHLYEGMTDEEYNYFLKYPNKYYSMEMDRYKKFARMNGRKLEISGPQDSPIIMCKKK